MPIFTLWFMKNTILRIIIYCILFLFQGCIVSGTGRPSVSGYIFDAKNNQPIEGCKVGETSTDINGYYKLKELRYLEFTFPGIEARPIYVKEIVEKKGYISDTLMGFNRYGSGLKRGTNWEMDTVFLMKK